MRPQVWDEHSHAMRWHAHSKRCSAKPTWSPLSIACAASMCGSQREDGDSISHSTDGNTQVSNGRCPSPILLRTQGLSPLVATAAQDSYFFIAQDLQWGARKDPDTKPSLQLCAHSTEQLPLVSAYTLGNPGHVAHTGEA